MSYNVLLVRTEESNSWDFILDNSITNTEQKRHSLTTFSRSIRGLFLLSTAK